MRSFHAVMFCFNQQALPLLAQPRWSAKRICVSNVHSPFTTQKAYIIQASSPEPMEWSGREPDVSYNQRNGFQLHEILTWFQPFKRRAQRNAAHIKSKPWRHKWEGMVSNYVSHFLRPYLAAPSFLFGELPMRKSRTDVMCTFPSFLCIIFISIINGVGYNWWQHCTLSTLRSCTE